MKINAITKWDFPLHATQESAGTDLKYMDITQEPIVINPLERKLIPTGLFIEIPKGYEGQIRPRSGLAYKFGITVLNSPGTIDSDYKGELKVLLINLSDTPYEIKHGDRIAQLVIAKYETQEFNRVFELSTTKRGEGGFGSTGNK